MDIQLQGHRCLVTGASSGIGAAIAEELGAAGARVAVNYLDDAAAADAVAQRIRTAGGEPLTVRADVADPAAVDAMYSRIDEAWGGLDVLVNNAGIDGPRSEAWAADLDAWRKVIDIDLIGAFDCARHALRRMVPAGHGVILTITSVHEVIPWSGYSAYTAAKAGAGMLTRTLAQEAAPHGIRVLALAPGAVKTSINRQVWSNPDDLADLLDKIPLNRMGEPADIARMAVVLVSDVAGYVTGTTVFVDGAMTDYPDFAHGG
jgi:NAD(P)-dependent dehydrogenase (short-subunit alcohol dehydrogenase family)